MAILNNNPLVGASGNQGGYNINNSLRFRSSASAYLNRTFTTPTNGKIWTLSLWLKRGALGSLQSIMTAQSGGSEDSFAFLSTDTIRIFFSAYSAGGLITNAVFRDPSAWYHIVLGVDTTQATASNRVKLYVNGTQQTFTGSDYPSQNATPYFNTALTHYIARYANQTMPTGNFDGYNAETHFIDGSQKAASDFGETDTTTGVWKPKAYTGTYGTNGFYLKFSDIATTSGSNAGLGKDFSGNSNYWTTNNISVTAGTTYDAMTDSPTNTSATVANYAVLNPIGGNSSMTLSNGNLNTSATAYSLHRYGTIGVSSGKWYWEVSPTTMSGASNGMLVGISNDIQETGATFNGARGYFSNNGYAYNGTSGTAYGATWTTNDIIGMALDLDAGTLVFYKNNVSQGTAFTGLTGEWFPLVRTDATVNSWINFGQRPFSYTPPTGYVALNTYNLPTPTILQGNKYMDATLYTGNGGTQTVSNGNFQPDFVWIKNRAAAVNHQLHNSNVGWQYGLNSNNTNAEYTDANAITGATSTGWSMNNNYNSHNQSGVSFIGWQWQAGQGSTSSNTSGSITSTVSVNTTAGFSIVTWTATGSNATIGHGLGVAPKMIITKGRNAVNGWNVYTSTTGNGNYLRLDTTAASTSGSTYWNNTSPTSTVFSTGTWYSNTETYVAYCFAEIAGFSAFGSYTGNGSTDGPFIYLGFRPKWIVWKRTDVAGYDWDIYDSSRDTYNLTYKELIANSTAAESSSTVLSLDMVSNGFKLRSSNANGNASGGTYIYAAFSENPLKHSLAR